MTQVNVTPVDPNTIPLNTPTRIDATDGSVYTIVATRTTNSLIEQIVATPGGVLDLANQAAANAGTIQTNLNARLATVETWLTNNPAGAVLNAAQTKVLMQGIAGLIRLLINQTSTVGGA